MACAACLGGAARAAGDLFDELYQRGQTRNADLRTLTATFTETSTSSLLTRPLVARGTVAVARPARVALRYSEPDERQLIIDGGRLTLTWPSRGIRQSRDVGAALARVQTYFVDSSPEELRRHFSIAARDAEAAGYSVTMVPTRKQLRDGLARLELAIDPASLLPTSMKMTFPNGDTKLMTFADVKLNVPLDAALFQSAPARR